MSAVARWLAALAIAAPAALGAGCGTCRTNQPPVQPRVGGGVSIGTGGVSRDVGLGLDVSNLFCRPPAPGTEPAPGPGSDPIPDAPAKSGGS